MHRLATLPHRGTVHPELRDGIRHVTDKSFVFYFEVDEQSAEVRVLVIFLVVPII